MTFRSVNVRQKGQITLPADLRDELGLKEGDRLLVERRGKEIVLILPEDVVDPTAGAFKDYAKGKHLAPEQIRQIAAQSIANQVMSELEEIERDRLNHVH